MADQKQAGEGFEFFIPPASAGRAIALGYASVVLLIPFLASLLADNSDWNPMFWPILLGISPLVAFFVLLAFPPLSWRVRLEVERDMIRYVPVALLRWIGEPATELPLTAQSHEVLICCGSRDTYDGFFVTDSRPFPYGFRVIIRSADGHDHELKVKTGSRLRPHHAQNLISGLASATGLSVRLIKREVRDNGTFQEVPWIPDARFDGFAALGKLAFAATPLLGGIVAGLSRASGARAALVGIVLWLAQTAIVMILSQPSLRRSKLTFAGWLTTAVTFAASYTVIFLITVNSLRAR